MHVSRIVFLLTGLLLLPACGGEAGAGASPTGVADQITKALANVTDQQTAERYKPQIESLTDQLASAMSSVKQVSKDAADKVGEAGSELGKMAGDLIDKAARAASPELKSAFSSIEAEITRLLNDPQVNQVIGPTLQKLQGLIGG